MQKCEKILRGRKDTIAPVVSALRGERSRSSDASGTYDEARRARNDLSLAERRHELGKRFVQRIIKDKLNVLFYLLPAKRNVQLTTLLRCARQYPTIYARTNRYKKNSFILFGLNHFQ